MQTIRNRFFATVLSGALLFGGFILTPTSAMATTNCPTLSAGQYVNFKGQISWLDDGNRWVFVNKDAFLTWQANTAKLKTIKSEVCLASFPVGGKIGYRPGSKLIKSGADFYSIGEYNTLHKLSSVAIAKSLYGANYKTLAKPMPANLYTIDSALDEAVAHDGLLLKKKGDKTVWYRYLGKLAKVEGKLPAFLLKDVRVVAASVVEDLEISDDSVIAAANIVTDPSQGATPKIEESFATVEQQKTIPKNSSPTGNKPSSVDVSKFTGANYKGPFPAPEGMVLEGWSGEDSTLEPTGSGEYRFRAAKSFRQPLACLDKTRTLVGSKGKTWEEGWFKGYDLGKIQRDVIFPIYNETPTGAKAGNNLYDEGYRLGYAYGFKGGFWAMNTYNCKSEVTDLARIDSDGWYTYGVENTPSLKTKLPNLLNVSTPINPWSFFLAERGTILNVPNSITINMETVVDARKPEGAPDNRGKSAVNLSAIDIFENMEADDNALSPKDFAKGFYDISKQKFESLNKRCAMSDANIEDKTYGNHSFTLLTYYSTCEESKSVSPLDKGDEGGLVINNIRYTFSGKLQAFAFTKGAQSGHLFGFFFYDPFDIHTKGGSTKDDIDMTKLPSNSFIEQFLTKVQVR